MYSVITNNVQTLAPALMLDFTRHLAFNCCQIELLFYKGPFNNYVDKMRGGGESQKCLFLSTLRV